MTNVATRFAQPSQSSQPSQGAGATNQTLRAAKARKGSSHQPGACEELATSVEKNPRAQPTANVTAVSTHVTNIVSGR